MDEVALGLPFGAAGQRPEKDGVATTTLSSDRAMKREASQKASRCSSSALVSKLACRTLPRPARRRDDKGM